VFVRDSEHVVFRDNAVTEMGPYATKAVIVDETADRATIDTSGIRES
jgi:hypothetical protein